MVELVCELVKVNDQERNEEQNRSQVQARLLENRKRDDLEVSRNDNGYDSDDNVQDPDHTPNSDLSEWG